MFSTQTTFPARVSQKGSFSRETPDVQLLRCIGSRSVPRALIQNNNEKSGHTSKSIKNLLCTYWKHLLTPSVKFFVSEILFISLIATFSASAAIRQNDFASKLTLVNELNAAGQYDAALAEAKKLEEGAKLTFGYNHTFYAKALFTLASIYSNKRQYSDAETLYKRSINIFESNLDKYDPDVASCLNNLAIVYVEEGRFPDAEMLLGRAIKIRETKFGKDSLEVAETLINIANIKRIYGQYNEADALLQRVITVRELKLGKNHAGVALAINNLASLNYDQGKLANAEALWQRALAIREAKLGKDHPDVATTLVNLALVSDAQGNLSVAEKLLQRALEILQRKLGNDNPDVALTLNNLALVYFHQGKLNEASVLSQRALAIIESNIGTNNLKSASIMNDLATSYSMQGKFFNSIPLYQKEISIIEANLGKNHPSLARAIGNLANDTAAQGQLAEATKLYQRALAMQKLTLGADNLEVALTLNNLAVTYFKNNDIANALKFERDASNTVVSHIKSEIQSDLQSTQTGNFTSNIGEYFKFHLELLALAKEQNLQYSFSLGHEGFEIAQQALQSSAGAALQQMAVRFASSGNSVAVLIREQQDLSASLRLGERALVEALSKVDTSGTQAAVESIRRKIAEAKVRFVAIAARLQKEFPDYAALTLPNPLTLEEVQKLLTSDEAMIFYSTGDKQTTVFAITTENFEWQVIPIKGDALTQKVAELRRGLEVRNRESFDLGLANELYVALLGPVEALIRDKKQILIVPTGVLTALPFHVLVTEKPTIAKPAEASGYRDAAWVIRRQAVTVLPSVASFKALRVFGRKETAAKPMVGFGDPVFNSDTPASGRSRIVDKFEARSLTTSSYTDFFHGAGVDRAKLSKALPPLPETEEELEAVAKDLGAPNSDIHLGKDASVTTVKRLRLSDYRIVYFATHGLVAGDIKGLAEPSLALSIPAHPSEADSGLLTASEVAQLNLNADWVVLSACNTAAGDKPGAEALSGLARAFFYAGARALLVSHWAVNSEAAARLTTSTFDILRDNPSVGRAEALRRAMLGYLNDPDGLFNAYPALWGSFEIVGEGDKK